MSRLLVLLTFLALLIVGSCALYAADDHDAQLAHVLGPDTVTHWELTGGAAVTEGGPFTIQDDTLLQRPVLICGTQPLTLTSKTVFRNVDVSFAMRIVTTSEQPSIGFPIQVKDPVDAAKLTQIYLVGNYNGNIDIGTAGLSLRYTMRAYTNISPTWPDTVRIPVERDMSGLPFSQDKWVRVRYRMGTDRVRIWIDDRLVADRTDGSLLNAGVINFMMQPGVRLADFSVRPLATGDASFETIALDGYVRDRTLLKNTAVADKALPFGQTMKVAGVPVRFVQRAGKSDPDHLDISRSLVHEGALEGYFASTSPLVANAFTLDPSRIRLRVPNGRYDALYVVAAFNGAKDRIPVLSAAFYRPDAGFTQFFETVVPAATSRSDEHAVPLPIKLENGTSANLWLVKIPLDPAKLASFSDMETLEVELTKQMKQYRSYPDPIVYGWHGAGTASGVQVYAVTLHRAEMELSLEPSVFGHVWTAPDRPSYNVKFTNHTQQPRTVSVSVLTTSYDKQEHSRQTKEMTVPAGADLQAPFTFALKKHGIHQLDVTMRDGAIHWTETRYFALLAPNTRADAWKEGEGPLFSYWAYMGWDTPPAAEIKRVMNLAGAHMPGDEMVLNCWPIYPQSDWAGADPVDPKKYEAYKETAITELRKVKAETSEAVFFFPEPWISRDLTEGNPPEYWGDPPSQLNEEEKISLRVHMNTAKAAAEAVRKEWPDKKIMVGWADPLFILPILKAGFPKDLIDGSGLDSIGFERLPEQQIHQMSTHRLYFLKKAFADAGFKDPQLYYVEGIFSPTEPGALTWQEQADIYHRWTLISLAYGITRFYSGWFAYDLANYYGAEHYGGCGIQRRIPYSDPKPGYAHYATMTRMLERSKFDRWLPTSSNTVYCLKFTRPSWTRAGQTESVYALWTLCGTRPVTLTLEKDTTITVTDSMDNGTPVTSTRGAATFTLGTSPVYVTGAGEVKTISLGKPDHSDAVISARYRNQETWGTGPADRKPPVTKVLTIANFGDNSWMQVHEPDLLYEQNSFDTKRFLGKMSSRITTDADRKGYFLAVHLEKQDKERQVMPWYTVLKPGKPLVIPGKACALGVWVRANSDWGRIVYVLNDAKGERWASIGTKDQWNCDDPCSRSSFDFDGWRYLRMELPASSEYDSFREFGTTWWGSGNGDGIVDLPLTLEKVIVERRTHVMYVNNIQPANPADVLLGELVAEYETPFDASKQAVKRNQVRMPVPNPGKMPNPIAEMTTTNPLPPVTLQKVTMPDWGYDGTTCKVHFTEVPNADVYAVWLSAYPDGRGAIKLPWTMTKSGGQIYGLRPAMKLYLWVTYTTKAEADKPAQASKPSNVLEIELVDAFAQK